MNICPHLAYVNSRPDPKKQVEEDLEKATAILKIDQSEGSSYRLLHELFTFALDHHLELATFLESREDPPSPPPQCGVCGTETSGSGPVCSACVTFYQVALSVFTSNLCFSRPRSPTRLEFGNARIKLAIVPSSTPSSTSRTVSSSRGPRARRCSMPQTETCFASYAGSKPCTLGKDKDLIRMKCLIRMMNWRCPYSGTRDALPWE